MAIKRGLPTGFKYEAKILKKADRDKLDAKPCPECKKVWRERERVIMCNSLVFICSGLRMMGVCMMERSPI